MHYVNSRKDIIRVIAMIICEISKSNIKWSADQQCRSGSKLIEENGTYSVTFGGWIFFALSRDSSLIYKYLNTFQ